MSTFAMTTVHKLCRALLCLLAFRAEVRGSAAEDNPFDRRSTAAAGLAFSCINLVAVLEFSGFAVDVHIVPEGGTAVADRFAQHQFDGFGESRGRGVRDFVGG